MNVNKRVLKCQPFLHRGYGLNFYSLHSKAIFCKICFNNRTGKNSTRVLTAIFTQNSGNFRVGSASGVSVAKCAVGSKLQKNPASFSQCLLFCSLLRIRNYDEIELETELLRAIRRHLFSLVCRFKKQPCVPLFKYLTRHCLFSPAKDLHPTVFESSINFACTLHKYSNGTN